MVEEIINGNIISGYHKASWDATDQSSGLYFIKLTAGEYQQMQKVMLVK